MKKKKKHSIKVSKDSNPLARARPINDFPSCNCTPPLTGSPCEASLCKASPSESYTASLCKASSDFSKNYCCPLPKEVDCYYNRIQMLDCLITSLDTQYKPKAEHLQTLMDIFKDFITLYSNCSETVNLLNSDFCATIQYGKVANCNPPRPSIKLYTLNWLLTNDTTGVPGFTDWGSLFTPNMTKMLFCAKNTNLGQNFAAALAALGPADAPAANPFLDAKGGSLCTGMSGVNSATGAKTTKPTFNFDTNFNKIATNIQNIISPGINCSYDTDFCWNCQPFSNNGDADISMTIDSDDSSLLTYPIALNLKSKNIENIFAVNPDNLFFLTSLDLSINAINKNSGNISTLNSLLRNKEFEGLKICENNIKCADLILNSKVCLDSPGTC